MVGQRGVRDIKRILTQEKLKELYKYDYEHGGLVSLRTGKEIGFKNKKGAIIVKIKDVGVRVHLLVWCWHYGSYPEGAVFHINGVVSDNRIENLRLTDKDREITQEVVRELYDYDPEVGHLIHKRSSAGAKRGDKVGTVNCTGYFTTRIHSKSFLVHRIIWLWMEGYWPESDIDHIDQNPLNNKWSNLRVVGRMCNARNCGATCSSTTGIRGVYFIRRDQCYAAKITVMYRQVELYYGKDLAEAAAHRLAAEQFLEWASCDSNSTAFQYMQKYVRGEL